MKVVFVSNFFNHHQKPFSEAMYGLIGDGYCFIETKQITEERLKMGWGEDKKPSYVRQNYTDEKSENECQKLIDDADIVIHGGAPHNLLLKRLKEGKLTFKYSERLYKRGITYKLPWHFLLNGKNFRRYKNLYLLCASAYTSADFAKTFTFLNKAYKWGYFPKTEKYESVGGIVQAKQPASILWVARFIEWKHPETAIEIAKRLKAAGYDFKLNMIGNGELENCTKELIQSNDLSDCVEMLGTMKPEQVRECMGKSEIFLFTSDKNEGWGAVLNEAMNSACAAVASHAIGSVPFLIRDKENGLIYKDGDLEDLFQKVKWFLDNPAQREAIGIKAYKTITEQWNAENAAERFLALAQAILNGEKSPAPYNEGVCSKAKILKDNWY